MTASLTSIEVVELARSWIGTPYHNQAATLGSGCDCLGLVRGVWAQLYGQMLPEVPVYSNTWAGRPIAGLDLLDHASKRLEEVDPKRLAPGLVVAFKIGPGGRAQHCGILSSGTTMVHAHSGRAVCEVSLGLRWSKRLVAAYKFPGVLV